jgi:hypothetical protein
MSSRQVPTTPEGKFGQQVAELISSMMRQQRFVIPTFAADPPETDPTNLWMRYDGRLRGRYWNGSAYVYVDYPMRSDITSPPAVPAYPTKPAQPSPPQSFQQTWLAQWSQTYAGSGAKRNDTQGQVNAVFGSDTANGYQKALVGFDYAAIATALASSTIQSVQLTVSVLSAAHTTTTLAVGMHNQASEPTTYDVTTTILRYGYQGDVQSGQISTHNLPFAFAQVLRAGTAKGLVLEAPSSDPNFLGVVAGVGSGYTPPQLTITYAK